MDICKMDTILFFSDFHNTLKGSSDRSFVRKLGLDLPSRPDFETMDTLIQLWWVNCLSKSKWNNMLPMLRNRVMQDFIDTLYCTSNAFDEIFMLFFVSAKSRYFMLGKDKKLGLSSQDLLTLAEDVLKYASIADVKYCHRNGSKMTLENLIDYPLKTFSLCPCTRRPLYVAMYLGRPDIVRLLLNCGARIPYEDVCVCTEDRRHPLRNVMEVMKAPLEALSDDSASHLVVTHRKRCVASLRTLLVDTCYTTDLNQQVRMVLKEISVDDDMTERIPTLKRIARSQIRLLMKSNRSLSMEEAFEDLVLPKSLITYLNIEEQL